MDKEQVTVAKDYLDRLEAIAKAAQRAVLSCASRHLGDDLHANWLKEMNELAVLVPSTRMFDRDPIT
jgi:hypothetical protein